MEAILLLLVVVAVVAFNPITWVVVTIILVARDRAKKKEAEKLNSSKVPATTATTTPAKTPPPPPPNPMAKWNWLLYIGSFLLVLAMFYFIDSINSSFVAPSTIALTLIIYAIGVVIHKKIDYLRPVGKAFVYSALCMIPLWNIALDSLGFSGNIYPAFVAFSFMIAAFAGAYMMKDKVMGHIAFLSIISLLWSLYALTDLTDDSGIYNYYLFLAPMVAGLLPMALCIAEPKWLSDTFKPAAKNLGRTLIPVTYGFSLFLLFIPNISTTTPLLRAICAAFFLIYAFLFFLDTKKRGHLVALRFAIQGLIIACVVDLLEFSIISIGARNAGIALCCVITWLLTFMIQVIYSLFCKKASAEDERIEKNVSIVSLCCIFLTPMFCGDFETAGLAAVWLTISFVIAVLGIVHALHYKNVSWSIATAVSVMVMPLIVGNYIANPVWDGPIYLICYTVIAILFLLGTFLLRMIQEKEAHTIGAICVIMSCLTILSAAVDMDLAYSGYIISAALLAGFAFITKISAFYEVAIYTGAVGLMALTSSSYGNSYGLEAIINAHIIGIAFICTQLLSKYIYNNKDQVRFILGYSLFSLMATAGCLSLSTSEGALVWALIFLIEQVAALVYSVFKKETWLIWFSSIEVFLIAFRLTGGMSYLWLGIIGVGLIAVVVWQLSKANKGNLAKSTSEPKEKPKIEKKKD